jgi:mRNA-degrading endonuclease RelE of RelBE toxin-antitoxin system
MSYKVITIPPFRNELKRLAKKYPSLKKEYADLIQNLESDPDLGQPLGKNCYKIRLSIASKNRGKSGGARIITYVLIEDTTVYLLSIYDKAEQSAITSKELETLIKSIQS